MVSGPELGSRQASGRSRQWVLPRICPVDGDRVQHPGSQLDAVATIGVGVTGIEDSTDARAAGLSLARCGRQRAVLASEIERGAAERSTVQRHLTFHFGVSALLPAF